MIIRCERCSTVYELDEALLAPEGSDVQCTRCQHVFQARRPAAAGQTLQGMQAAEPPPPPPPAPAQEPEPEQGAAAPAAAPEPHPVPASLSRQPPRYTPTSSSASAPVYRPISQPSVPRAPLIRRDTVGAFESRLRWSHRWKWLAPTLFAVVVAAAVVVFLLRDGIVIDPRARQAQRAALDLAYRDDVSSLEQARARLEEAVRLAPRLHAARADRALVDLLLAQALTREPLDRPAAPPPPRASALTAEAAGELQSLETAHLAPGEVARARAVEAAAMDDREQLKRLVTVARGRLGDDPFVIVAETAFAIRIGDKPARQAAVEALPLLLGRRPEVVRARYELARGQALLGRRAEALGTVEALLKTNPGHEGALRLKESLTRKEAAPVPAPAPTPPPKTEKPAPAARKPDSTPGDSAAAPSAGAAPAPQPSRPTPPQPAAEPPPASSPEGTAGAPAGEGEPPAPAPRVRPAAVPDPEPVQGGG